MLLDVVVKYAEIAVTLFKDKVAWKWKFGQYLWYKVRWLEVCISAANWQNAVVKFWIGEDF